MPMNATQNQTEAGAVTDAGRRPTVVTGTRLCLTGIIEPPEAPNVHGR